jgi:hypothetical protein
MTVALASAFMHNEGDKGTTMRVTVIAEGVFNDRTID